MVTLLIAACLFLVAASARAADTENSTASFPEDIQRIIQRGHLIVAMYHQDRPPFFYLDSQGVLAGVEVEMAKDIARRLGVEVTFNREAASFSSVIDLVAAGKADVAISKLSMTIDRAMRVSFTSPYLTFHHALLINRLYLADLREENRKKTSLQLLQAGNLRLGIRGPSSWNEYAGHLFPDAEIVNMENWERLVKSTAQGKLGAVMYDEFEIKSIIHDHPELNINLEVLVLNDHTDRIGMAVAAENDHLLSWLDFYLAYSDLTPGLRTLQKEYTPKNIP